MQSRRREDYITLSPASKLRGQHRLEMGSDYPYSGARHDALDRSPRRVALDRSPRARRSMSPHRLDGSRRVAGGSQRSRSIERREYHQWHLSGSNGGRGDQIRSRSPPFEQVRKRAQFDDDSLVMHRNYVPPMELRRGYELCDRADFKVDDDNLKSKHVLLYEHNSSRIGKERDFSESRLAAVGGHGRLAQNSMAMEDGIAHGSYRLTQDLGPTSDYREIDGHLSSSSRSIDIRRFEHERPQYQDTIAMDKLPIMDSYKDGEKPMFQSRDMPYPIVSASHSKGFAGTSPLADLSSSSSRLLRSEFLGSYRDDMHLPPPSGEFSRSSGKLADPLGFNAYEERPLIDSSGEPEAGKRNLTYYQRGACSPTRAECEDYPYPKLYGIANDDRGYLSDDLYRMMPPQVSLDYDHARSDYDHRDLPRPNIMHHAVSRVDNITEDSYRNPRKGTSLDHSTLHKQTVSEYLDTNRMSNASKQGGEYLGSRRSQAEFERRLSPEYETSHLGASQDRQILHMRADFGFGKNAGPKFLKERLQSPPVSKYDLDGHRHSVKMQRMDEHGLSEPSDRMLKRKFSFKEELSGHDSRKIMSNKWNASRGLQDRYDSGEEWIDEDTSALYSSNSVGLDRNEYRKPKRIYDRLEYRQDFANDNWVSSQDSLSQTQRHSVGLYKRGGRYRAHPRTGFLSSHNLHHFDRRSGLQKLQSNVWKRNDDYHEDEQEDDGDPSEDWVNPLESEPSEDSEEFKQLVQEAFLKYCKKLNVNPAVRRRYKEQGKAGSFFCIVCGKSHSKEFLDTQRLVTHAFMSHKVGLRSQHLGLHKAICVLLGWNTVVPQDTITWSPEVLPNAEALAQKEDLILWPPLVVVHNISMSDSNPRKWKVVKVEEVEAFLREKGFIRGRIKVCLGRPSDRSVMVIKFLGTFTGLGDAEKLHKYFDENKRGRVDFERITSNNGKSSKSWDAGNQGEKVEEHILYGYMGIAEDLDKVDYNTRKSCVIKSKMEIQDLANAPLRPDER